MASKKEITKTSVKNSNLKSLDIKTDKYTKDVKDDVKSTSKGPLSNVPSSPTNTNEKEFKSFSNIVPKTIFAKTSEQSTIIKKDQNSTPKLKIVSSHSQPKVKPLKGQSQLTINDLKFKMKVFDLDGDVGVVDDFEDINDIWIKFEGGGTGTYCLDKKNKLSYTPLYQFSEDNIVKK